ncbi:bifunctional aspartate transaminase/aspartate 4-decarboxylase [uncultured Cetobacterium sp.]|uniref:bifunctional aspartate transaminase/aspartate 4-decarboxylase n=1 Tax=uncultured Cetobacterium sp. TaxID=527638 RepID=UPI0026047105|nr:bifunctional aspartate transaminase/aspartate 4-decarboxylase [uncultured Cetobacterium sp.]
MKELSPFELKDELIAVASKEFQGEILNAGRGNPNFLATLPRKMFNLLGKFAIEESEFAYSYFHNDLGGFPRTNGLYTRFLMFLRSQDEKAGSSEMLVYLSYAQDQLGLNVDELLEEFVNAYLANNYPCPPRSLKNIEKIVKKYIVKEMCNNSLDAEFDVFPTEGGTAAMAYIFNSMKANKLMKAKDKIALITPIFTPYLEIPGLPEYDFEIVELRLDPKLNWQLPQSELDKLKDPAIKLLCIVNPSNPSSTMMSMESIHQLKEIVDNDRPDLMIVTDDVYGTFADNFVSCFSVLPYNTLLVYSFSKYFGATGWRLGTIALAHENVFQDNIKKLSTENQNKINTRYSIMTSEPENLKFIDRLVADSRAVGLNHTAGLSTPQQLQMALFSLNSLVDLKENYKQCCKELVRSRCELLYSSLGIKLVEDVNIVNYYTLIDLKTMAASLFDDEFANWFEKNNKVNDFLFALAKETGVVLMPGKGFGDTTPTLRVSLANLKEYQYEAIGKYTRRILKEFYENYKG